MYIPVVCLFSGKGYVCYERVGVGSTYNLYLCVVCCYHTTSWCVAWTRGKEPPKAKGTVNINYTSAVVRLIVKGEISCHCFYHRQRNRKGIRIAKRFYPVCNIWKLRSERPTVGDVTLGVGTSSVSKGMWGQ